MKNKGKIIVLIVSISLVLLILTGITYAYYITKVTGNTNNKSVSIKTANLELIYLDGDGNGDGKADPYVTATNIIPGTPITKKVFTVTNNGNETVEGYIVYLENVINTFELREDVRYTLNCKASSGSCNSVASTPFPVEDSILVSNNIDVGVTHTYTLKVEFIETYTDQSIDMNKTLSGKIDIYDRLEKNPNIMDDINMKETVATINKLADLAYDFSVNNTTDEENKNVKPSFLIGGNNSNTELLAQTTSNKTLVFNSISKISYSGTKWDETAGPKNTAFHEYLSGKFDINVFKNMKYKATDSGEMSSIVHFSAALSAMQYNTDPIAEIFSGMDEVDFNNFAGWAGDLQTLIKNNIIPKITTSSTYDEVYTLMSNSIGKSGTYFDSDDLYADIDAINISKIINGSGDIKDIFNTYFTINYKNRFYSFMYNILKEVNSYTKVSDEQTYIDFKAKVKNYVEYKSKWMLYDGVDTTKFTTSSINAMTDAFTDYIFYLGDVKNVVIFSPDLTYNKGKSYNFKAEYTDRNNTLDTTITNTDYEWKVSKVDGTSCTSTIDNEGKLTISNSETLSELLITATLKKSNKIVATKNIKIS